MRRVVVTGMGTVNSLGVNVKESWRQLLKGRSGLVSLRKFTSDSMPDISIAPVHSDFQRKDYKMQFIDCLANSMLLKATEEALADSGLGKFPETTVKRELPRELYMDA